MALHFYMNGTTGAQDGVEISNGDLSNPLLFDGFYAATGIELSKTKTIHIRADEGEVWHMVTVVAGTNSSSTKSYVFLSGSSTIEILSGYSSSTSTYTNALSNTKLCLFPVVKNNNMPITITSWVIGGEPSPDTSIKLFVVGGYKE